MKIRVKVLLRQQAQRLAPGGDRRGQLDAAACCLAFGLGGFVLAWLYQRYRAGRPELFVVHLIYWLGLYPGRGRSCPNALQQAYRP